MAIITVWQREFHHQTPIAGPHRNGFSTFECFGFPTIDSCKMNPFHLRKKKKKHGWLLVFEVAIYILAMKVSFFVSSVSATLGCFSLHKFSTRRHFTLFTIYLTPETWYISLVVFNVLSAAVENGKVTCVSLCEWMFFFSQSPGEILHKYILFSCCQWEQKILLKCPCGWLK